MFRFRFRRMAVRAGLVRAEVPDLSSSEWAEVRVALQEGRQAYAKAMASAPTSDFRSSNDRASKVDYALMVQ